MSASLNTTRDIFLTFAFLRAHMLYFCRPLPSTSLSVTEITQLQIVFTPGNERRLNKSKINCCNYSPAPHIIIIIRLRISPLPHKRTLTCSLHPYINVVTILGVFLFKCSSLEKASLKQNHFDVTRSMSRQTKPIVRATLLILMSL